MVFVARLKGKIGAMACVWLASGCAATGMPCDSADVPWQAVAPSVWVWMPEHTGEIGAGNGGHVAPVSAVVDAGEAVVIDPGPGHRHGERVKQSLQCRFGARVVWVVNTHAHAENVLGNSAFAREQAQGQLHIGASAATREGMRQRCPACLASLTARVGAGAMQGTAIVLPDRTLAPGQRLRVGERSLLVQAVEQGHTEGDLLLWDDTHGVLWAGGLVYGERVPELAQGHVDAWLAALRRLQGLPVRTVIGATWSTAMEEGVPPPALASTRGYLEALRAGVLQAMDAGRLPQEPGVVPLPAWAQWPGYAERHGFNVLRAWRELEPVWMEQSLVEQPGR